MMSRHGIVGRLTKNIAGTAARKKRTAASAKGGISRSATLIGTKANPKSATTAMISAKSGAVSDERVVNGTLGDSGGEFLWYLLDSLLREIPCIDVRDFARVDVLAQRGVRVVHG